MTKFGLEVECCANTEIVKLGKDGYHGHDAVTFADGFWKSERDGSLRYGDFTHSDAYEFISKKCEDEEEFRQAVKKFVEFFSNNGKHELNEVLNFNDSTGCHVHFSLDNDKFKFKKLITFTSFMALRNFFFTRLSASSLNSDAKRKIKERYFRSYSRKLTKGNFNNTGERYSEFNFCSEDAGLGMEWRSPNLTGINTWKEFEEMMSIILDSVVFFIKNRSKFVDKKKSKIDLSLLSTPMETSGEKMELNISVTKRFSMNNVVVNRKDGLVGKNEIINVMGLEFV